MWLAQLAFGTKQHTYDSPERPLIPPPGAEPEKIDGDRDLEKHEGGVGGDDALPEPGMLKLDELGVLQRIQVFTQAVLCLDDEY